MSDDVEKQLEKLLRDVGPLKPDQGIVKICLQRISKERNLPLNELVLKILAKHIVETATRQKWTLHEKTLQQLRALADGV